MNEARKKVLNNIDTAYSLSGFFIDEKTFDTPDGDVSLRFQILPNQIEIIDKDNPYFQMSASVQKDDKGERFAAFRIYNSKDNKKHPLISGRAFIEKALDYFDRNGHKPHYIKAVWEKSGELASMNAESFEKSNQLDLESRAKQTWTGKILSELGYPRCTVKENDEDRVVVHFFS